jgi:hypothetical protein
MGSNYAPNPGATINTAARPAWRRTGNKHFPFAAHHGGQWWVLRVNFGFPEHDIYTLFIDAQAAADITATPAHRKPLLASIGVLNPFHPDPTIPILDDVTATAVVNTVGSYVDYGSEHGDPCIFCSTGDGSRSEPVLAQRE